MRKLGLWLIINLLLVVWQGHAASPAVEETPGERKVRAAIRADLGPELAVKRIEVRERPKGVYRVDLEADIRGYPEPSRKQIRALVKQLVGQTLSGLGFELDPDSRMTFIGSAAEVSEVRGERPLTVVLFMPESAQPRTVRLSPRSVRAMGKNDLGPAGTDLAAALGVSDKSMEILVNTRQVYLRWRNLVRAAAENSSADGPIVVYARWWGNPPPPMVPPRFAKERKELLKPWWVEVRAWQVEMDARVSSGATGAAAARARTNGRFAPEILVGAGDFWLSYLSFSHDSHADRAFAFASNTPNFPAASSISFELQRFELAMRHVWYQHDENRLYAMTGLQLYLPEARIDSGTVPQTLGKLTGTAFGPVIGLMGDLRLSKHMALTGAVKLQLAYGGNASVAGPEFDLALAYRMPGGFEGRPSRLSLGWRGTDLEVRRGDGNESPRAGAVDPTYSGVYLDWTTSF